MKCLHCGGRCDGSSPATMPSQAVYTEDDEWVRIWETMRAVEQAVRDAWYRDAAILAGKCEELRKLVLKLLRMLFIVRTGRVPAPSEFQFDF
jgi:hypothetical protein